MAVLVDDDQHAEREQEGEDGGDHAARPFDELRGLRGARRASSSSRPSSDAVAPDRGSDGLDGAGVDAVNLVEADGSGEEGGDRLLVGRVQHRGAAVRRRAARPTPGAGPGSARGRAPRRSARRASSKSSAPAPDSMRSGNDRP